MNDKQAFWQNEKLMWLVFLAVLALQWWVHTHGLVYHDLIWSFEVGKRLYQGGTYSKDFFETNPPLLYFVHGALVTLADTLKLKPITVFCSFMLALSTLSFFISTHVIKKIFHSQPKVMMLFSWAIVLALSVLVSRSYGQKEQMMVIFSLPFFLAYCWRLEASHIDAKWAVLIGSLAGIGFAFKPPYFFIPLCLLEFYQIYLNRSLKSLWRVDLLVVVVIQLLYLLSVWVFAKDYLTVILPVILKTYVPVSYANHLRLFGSDFMLLFYLLTLVWWGIRKPSPMDDKIKHIFLIPLGFALSYYVQGKGWSYQGFPVYFWNFIFAILVLIHGLKNFKGYQVERNLFMGSFSLVILIFYLALPYQITQYTLQCYGKHSCDFLGNVNRISSAVNARKFFLFCTHMRSVYLFYYSPMKLASRFASLWPLPGIINKKGPKDKKLIHLIQTAIVEDFQRYNPPVVLIHESDEDYILDKNFDFIKFMLKDKRFKKIWQNYHFEKRLEFDGDATIIYRRNPSPKQ